jgi:hypothetical protein
MLPFSKIIIGLIFSLSLVALAPAFISAYVLQGPHILQLMTEKLGQAESLFVFQKVIFYKTRSQTDSLGINGNGETGVDEMLSTNNPLSEYVEDHERYTQTDTVQLDESLSYIFSRAFRSDILAGENQRIHVCNDGQVLKVVDGIITETGETRYDLYKDLLLYRTREALSERLSSLGIDVSISSLGRYEEQIAFVVGAEYPDETVPQVWIDKETFQPVRWLIASGNGPYASDQFEIRYLEWQKFGEIWYPMRVEFVQDGTTVRVIEVENCRLNPNFSEDIFDISHLKAEYRSPAPISNHPSETEGLSEVQKTIEEFKKIFE